MGSLWSRLCRRSETSQSSASASTAAAAAASPPAPASRERRGRSRTRTPPAFRPTKTSTDAMPMAAAAALPANTAAANTTARGKPSRTSHEFVWKYGGSRVILTGNFDDWSESVVMVKDHANGVFRANVTLDPTKTWYFKFVVDGVWRCSLDFCTETDASGNVNNVLYPEASQSQS